MIKVLIADDHPVVRSGTKQFLEKTSDIVVTGEASNGEEALDKIEKESFDVLLLDISMPGSSGMDVLRQIKKINPDIQVLILTMHPERQYAVRALKMGAAGYLTKESPSEELVTAIRTIATGKRYISESLAETLAYYIEREKNPHENLSHREHQIMRKICSGKRLVEIAEELSLNISTVSTYHVRILKKMNMKNDVELSHYAVKHKLVL